MSIPFCNVDIFHAASEFVNNHVLGYNELLVKVEADRKRITLSNIW